jgi:hypothetical protein
VSYDKYYIYKNFAYPREIQVADVGVQYSVHEVHGLIPRLLASHKRRWANEEGLTASICGECRPDKVEET